MNRLQKKCLVASVGTHLLLAVVLFVGPALTSRNQMDDLPVLDFVPATLIDAPFYGGGTPNAKPPPPAPPAPPPPQPQPQETPPAPKTFLQKIFEPEPPKETVKTPGIAPNLDKTVVKVPGDDVLPAAKSRVEVSTKVVKRSASSTSGSASSRAEARAAQLAAAKQRAEAFGSALRSLRENLSSGTTVDIPGPGGAAYANYGQVVKSVYTQAWIVPSDVAEDDATARVSVTIARDGTVISARLTDASGSAPVDRSVQHTLNRVKFVAPFPEGAKEDERTFIINFNLKTKRSLG
jgi:TonB family protein